jgi:osmoprotectant transport system ATP-binding protein
MDPITFARMDPITFENISHTYADHAWALNDISIVFPANKITVIVGESGSGKSSMLQLINGLIRPSQGSIYCFGQRLDYHDINKLRRKIGYCVQGVGLFPHLTVEQNISLGFNIFSTEDMSPATRVIELMQMMNLPLPYRKRYPFELSGGEQQRVGICRAVFNHPPILLLDEPLGALDALSRNDLQKKIKELQQLGNQTIVFVTHDLREAARLGDYTAVLKNGVLQQFDKTTVVINQPSNDYVQALIKASL